ncbi:hypothetical protein MNBD_ALPHA01-839 [hydrothermal vent metagenome]|uniref:HTH tetR-type domain-containing protein n=1 Tax=hydrothermal vent metagenome TaxID=652676 RepID=A0A3B0S3C3_9ZZZZ
MVRKAEFDGDDFILAAIGLIAHGGPTAATMNAIAISAGAPTGSIYHRFKSRSALLGAAWLYALSAMSDEILPDLMLGQSDDAVSALIRWVEMNPAMARMIMLYSENDLIDGELPPTLHKELNQANQKLGTGLSTLLKHRRKALTAANLALANFAVFDGPIAAMKPFLRSNSRVMPALNMAICRKAALACTQTSLELLE